MPTRVEKIEDMEEDELERKREKISPAAKDPEEDE